MNDNLRSQSLTHLDSRKRSPTSKIVRAAANECRRSEDGNVTDEVVVVEIKRFAVIESICKARLRISTPTAELTPLRRECSKEATPHAAGSIVGRSLALFVHLSTTSPPTPALHNRACLTSDDGLSAYGTTAPSRPAQQTPQALRSSIAYLAFRMYFQRELTPHSTECICLVALDLSNFRSFVLAIPPQILRAVLTIQRESAKGLSSRSQRVVAAAMSAEEFIIHAFNQRRWRDLH